MATIPDVCKTPSPGGPVPIPYPNIALETDLVKGTTTVKADGGNMCANYGSEFMKSTGDEPGVVGGIASSTFIKEASWITYSFDVKLESKGACRLTDKMFHNHQNTANLTGDIHDDVVNVKVDPKKSSIVCMKGKLVVQNNTTGPSRHCTELHELSHMEDWEERYGPDPCKDVPDGELPSRGPEFDKFYKETEIKAHTKSLACLKQVLESATENDKAEIQLLIRAEERLLEVYTHMSENPVPSPWKKR